MSAVLNSASYARSCAPERPVLTPWSASSPKAPAADPVDAPRDPSPAPPTLDSLRETVRRLEGGYGERHGVLPLGIPDIDARLPGGGLARAALHEIQEAGAGPGTAFAAWLAGQFLRSASKARRCILWCTRESNGLAADPYLPGLFGLMGTPAEPVPAEAVVMVAARTDAEALWVMEEALRCPALAVVVGEVDRVALTAGRRLQLAAEAGGTTGILLRRARCLDPATTPSLDASAAATRWRLASAPSQSPRDLLHRMFGSQGAADRDATDKECSDLDLGLGPARWQLDLIKSRGGGIGAWMVDHDHATGDLALAAEAVDRPDHAGGGARPVIADRSDGAIDVRAAGQLPLPLAAGGGGFCPDARAIPVRKPVNPIRQPAHKRRTVIPSGLEGAAQQRYA